jgi:hypothetical protein
LPEQTAQRAETHRRGDRGLRDRVFYADDEDEISGVLAVIVPTGRPSLTS